MNLSATPRSFKTMLHGAAVAAGLGALVVSTVYCQDPTYASVRLVPTSQFCVDGFSRAAILAGNADVARTVPKAVSATTVLCDGDAAKTLVLQPTRQGDTASFGVVVVAAKSDTALAECIQSGQFENCVVARRILSYKTNSALRLEIGLDSSCAGVDASCQTPSAANVPGYLGACVAGLCNNGNLTGREAECVDAVCDDNSLPCTAGERRACGSVRTIGICKRGEQTCGPRGRWEACMGELRPTGLDCTSSRDNNCDGQPDAASSLCKCDGTFSAGQTQACEPHPGKDGLGPCQPGLRSCVASASGVDAPAWGPCAGSIGPTPSDVCSDTIDNDCNGIVNDGCACKADAERACGPVALNQVGICVAGTQKCTDGKWPSTCSGSVDPKARDCSSPLDNDCNRVNDNLETACLCDGTVPVGGKQTCNGHGSLDGVGQCRAGSRTCTLGAGGAPTFGPCADAVGPATDGPGFCDGIDN
ncbi:MAG: hypothetical protein KBF88_15325, partial [Polyangiaceae bacterium]|nr:hypothetical protein [Polyangiaceae bacterium]